MSLRSLVLSFIVILGAALPARADYQPHMLAARDHLNAALASLEKADADKGGHRAKAMQTVRAAIDQINKGIAFDNAHRGHR